MQINDLPNDCLRSIFDHFSLQELIQQRAVCSHWQKLIEKICAQKSSLKLFESFNVVYNYCNCLLQYTLHEHEDFVLKRIFQRDDDLLISGRPVQKKALKDEKDEHAETTGHLLADLFPNLSKLVFYYYNWPTEMKLHSFLSKWSDLTSLSLLGMPHLKKQHTLIWDAINSLQFLNRLHLFEITDSIPQLPVLQHLEQFTLVNYDGDIVALLSQLGTSIRHLTLDGINCELHQLEELLRRAPHLCTNLTHLTIGHLFCSETTVYKSRAILSSILHLICTTFKSLHYFHPKFVYQLPLAEQVEEIVQMEQLYELRLQIHSFQMRLDPEQAYILSQLTAICIINLDYTLLDMAVAPAEFVHLVPTKFVKVHTLNVTVEFHETDFFTLMQQYFRELQTRVKYSVNFKDCQLGKYMGRHRERYVNEYENAIV